MRIAMSAQMGMPPSQAEAARAPCSMPAVAGMTPAPLPRKFMVTISDQSTCSSEAPGPPTSLDLRREPREPTLTEGSRGMDDTVQQWEDSSPSGDLYRDLAAPPAQAWAGLTILPAQLYPPAASPAHGRPEAALMRAVLDDAVQCIREGWHSADRSKQHLAREALGWLLSEDEEWPFSFVNICTMLGLDPEYFRRGLRSWQRHPPSLLPKRKRRVIGARYGRRIVA